VQCLNNVDPTLDLSPGSPYSVSVIQPILQRLGTDPFTVDIGLFIQTTLNQQFPDMPTKEGDAITDLLVKAGIVLWNPIVREITRVANNLSFANPTILTSDEAQALGANLFASIESGKYATGVVRIYFASPQSIGVTPANFVTSQEGYHFFPTQSQSIRVDEMLLNIDGTLYYFDVNVIAEAPGSQYNIAADDVVTIANVASATRITNLVAFANGIDAQTVVEYVNSIEQGLTERSLVTERGIIFQVENTLSEVVSCFPIGFNDPEMERDVLTGGGLGPILAAGFLMATVSDGQSALLTRRMTTTDPGVDFTQLIGPTGSAPAGFVVTVFNAFPVGSLPLVRDLAVLAVVNSQTLDLADQVLAYTTTNPTFAWTLRQNSLTLSGIPGGILFPNTPFGTIQMPNGEVHIGGCTDVYVAGSAFNVKVLTLNDIVDDDPVLEGVLLNANITPTLPNTSWVELEDYTLAPGAGGNYSVNDPVWTALNNAEANGLSIEILDPPNAGTYRILTTQQIAGASPQLLITPAIEQVTGAYRWHISDSIFIDLLNPKQTKISGSDMSTVLGQSVVTTASGVDFANYGVAEGDILQLLNGGLVMGHYTVKAVQDPFFNQILVDRPLSSSVNDVSYVVYTPNTDGGMVMPFVRITSIELLDTSGQPVGTTIPYAKPVDCQTNGFASIGSGVKADIEDGILGLVSAPFPEHTGVPGLNLSGLTLNIADQSNHVIVNVVFTPGSLSGGWLSPADVATQVGFAIAGATTPSIPRSVVTLGADINNHSNRVGFLPIKPGMQVNGGTALFLLFGYSTGTFTTRDITSATVYANGGWASLRPALDASYDVAQTLDGNQVGFFQLAANVLDDNGFDPVPNIPFSDLAYDPLRTLHDFNPAIGTHVQVGARSLGTVELYFIDPTSFEVTGNTVFSYTAADGSVLNYFPDPSQKYQRIPALPSGAKPLDGTTGTALLGNAAFFRSLSTNFVTQGVQYGDELIIDFAPLTGTVVLADPVVNLNTKTLTISLDGGPDKTIIFINDSSAIGATDVTRAGVVAQINNVVGSTICSLNASNQLTFSPTLSLIVRGASGTTGVGPGAANAILGFSLITGVDQNNEAPDAGTYTITSIAPGGNVNVIQVDPVLPSAGTGAGMEQFSVLRPGVQRIVSTTMSTNTESGGLYGFQVQLVSQGTGPQYNLGAGLQLTVDNYHSDGYYLTTDDPNLSFSPAERPKLILSTSILAPGVSDSPDNATFLGGQNIQVNYDQSAPVQDTNNFITADTERVICSSPLARHLNPYFVRLTLVYFGGSTADLVTSDVEAFIAAILPSGTLNVSDLENICANRNATSVMNPIDLIAIIHNVDRSLTAERSQNALNTGRLAAFFPDVLQISRNISGSGN
jgi:hypothetical protein